MPKSLKQLFADPHVQKIRTQRPQIAVAKDEAFCFLYEDNLKLLEELGAEITFFSPLHNAKVPENADGLLLPGGYPELFEQGFPKTAKCLHRSAPVKKKRSRSWQSAAVLCTFIRKCRTWKERHIRWQA